MTKTRLELGPLHLPLSLGVQELVDAFIRTATGKGYVVATTETDQTLRIVAIKHEQPKQSIAPELAGAGA